MEAYLVPSRNNTEAWLPVQSGLRFGGPHR